MFRLLVNVPLYFIVMFHIHHFSITYKTTVYVSVPVVIFFFSLYTFHNSFGIHSHYPYYYNSVLILYVHVYTYYTYFMDINISFMNFLKHFGNNVNQGMWAMLQYCFGVLVWSVGSFVTHGTEPSLWAVVYCHQY